MAGPSPTPLQRTKPSAGPQPAQGIGGQAGGPSLQLRGLPGLAAQDKALDPNNQPGFDEQSAAQTPVQLKGAPPKDQDPAQQGADNGRSQSEPSGLALPLHVSGEKPIHIMDHAAKVYTAAANARFEKMNLALENFETNVLMFSEDNRPGIITTIVMALVDKFYGTWLGERGFALQTLEKVGSAILGRSSQGLDGDKDLMSKFMKSYRREVLAPMVDDKVTLSLQLVPRFKQLFQEKADGSWRPYDRDDDFVEGPQAAYLRHLTQDSENEAIKARSLSQGSIEQVILTQWIAGQTATAMPSADVGNKPVLSDGYIRVHFESELDWSKDDNGPPTGIRTTRLDGAYLVSAAAKETVQHLKETSSSLDIWALKVPKRIIVHQPSDLQSVVDVEVGPNGGLTTVTSDRYGLYTSGPWYGYPVPSDALKAD